MATMAVFVGTQEKFFTYEHQLLDKPVSLGITLSYLESISNTHIPKG